jgi:hypothetical protein
MEARFGVHRRPVDLARIFDRRYALVLERELPVVVRGRGEEALAHLPVRGVEEVR